MDGRRGNGCAACGLRRWRYERQRLVLDPNTGNGLANSVVKTGSTADGKAATVITAVPVASTTTIVAVSTTARDLSASVTLSPTGTADTAHVAAQQTLSSATPITIRYRSTDLAPASYALADLPNRFGTVITEANIPVS
jgi:mRNA-degrading endonuclease toxin of MazEF toxin-antitoxin module